MLGCLEAVLLEPAASTILMRMRLFSERSRQESRNSISTKAQNFHLLFFWRGCLFKLEYRNNSKRFYVSY